MVWQLLWLLVATQCPQQREKVTGADLYGMWWHSYEEDTDGKVYRREGHQFPLSRQGRQGLELQPEGQGSIWETGPADRPEATPITWHLHKGRTLEVRALENPDRSFRVTLLVCEADRLVVKE